MLARRRAGVSWCRWSPSYEKLLYVAFFLGMAGCSFAVGVGFVSRWFPPEKQGSALGIYGLGNIGQSAAVFLGPVLAVAVGWQNIFRGMAALLVVWGVVFFLLARNAPTTVRPAELGRDAPASFARAALLGAVRFLLPDLRRICRVLHLPADPAQGPIRPDARRRRIPHRGLRGAGDAARPLGGWLSDRIGGARVLHAVFLGVIPFALLLAWPSMLPFTVGALGCAACWDSATARSSSWCRNIFPKKGTVTGLVGAMGGLGGFFPPLLLGFFRDHLHTVWPGFALLAFLSRCSLAHQCYGFRAPAAELRPRLCRHRSRGPRTACARAPRPRSAPACWSRPSWSARAICRTSIPRWSSTPSR